MQKPTVMKHEIVKHPQKFIRYKDGADLYCMSQKKFEREAHAAGAVYKINQLVLVNIEIFEEYLETFRIVDDGRYR